jgi:hypothetical protein
MVTGSYHVRRQFYHRHLQERMAILLFQTPDSCCHQASYMVVSLHQGQTHLHCFVPQKSPEEKKKNELQYIIL